MVEAIPILLLLMIVLPPIAYLYGAITKQKNEFLAMRKDLEAERERLIMDVDSMLQTDRSQKTWDQALEEAQRAEDSLLSKVKSEYFGG